MVESCVNCWYHSITIPIVNGKKQKPVGASGMVSCTIGRTPENCTLILKPKFYYGQKVKIINGFYRGKSGVVKERFSQPNEYRIDCGWGGERHWIKAEYLEAR